MSFGMLFYQNQEPYIASLRHVPYLMITQNFLRPNNGAKRKTGHGISCENITMNNDFCQYVNDSTSLFIIVIKLRVKIP